MMTLPKVRDLQWGSMEKFFICCVIRIQFLLRVCHKPTNVRGEFEFDWAKSKNKMAKISFSLVPETHSRPLAVATSLQGMGTGVCIRNPSAIIQFILHGIWLGE